MLKIPFVKNRKSNAECMQAALIMVLRYYGIRRASFAQINKYTKFKSGGYSFFASAINYLLNEGLKVTLIEKFDYRKFAKGGVVYMKSVIDEKVFNEFEKHIDLAFESRMMQKNLNNPKFTYVHRRATLKDIEKNLKKGIPVITSINPNRLEGSKKYGSHSVVILDINKDNVTFHDPGLPALKAAKVKRKLFLKAFTDGDPDTSNLILVEKAK